MNTILILLIFSISLLAAFLLGRFTAIRPTKPAGTSFLSGKETLKNKIGFREKTTFHSPSKKAQGQKDLDDITNG